MPIESATYISQLDETYPVGATDNLATADNHLRLIKDVLKNSFGAISGAVTATYLELNILDGATLTTAQLNQLAVTLTASRVVQLGAGGVLESSAVTNAELGHLSGVTSALQTQLDLKAPLASPALTGVPTAPTAGVGTSTTQLATTAFVNAEIANDAQPLDATLTALAGVTTAADKLIYATASDTFSTTDLSVAARTLLDDASVSAMRTTLGVAIGSDVQAYDSDLTTLGGLAKTDGNFIVGNGSTWVVESGATARTSLGLEIDTDVQAVASDVSGFAKGQTVFIEGDVGAAGIAFAASTYIGAAWESVGPTGSGATNTWATMDVVPSGAKWVEVLIRNSHVRTSANSGYQGLYARKTGSTVNFTQPQTAVSFNGFWGPTGTNGTEVSDTAKIPIDANLRFDLYRDIGGAGSSFIAQCHLYLIGWGE